MNNNSLSLTKKSTNKLKRNSDSEEDIEKKIKELVNPTKKYSSLKYREGYYSLGDCIITKSKETREYIIGKLIEIIPRGGTTKYPNWPSIKIRR